jgi:hypothetical protein
MFVVLLFVIYSKIQALENCYVFLIHPVICNLLAATLGITI